MLFKLSLFNPTNEADNMLCSENNINDLIQKLWAPFDQYNVDEKLHIFAQLKATATKGDLSLLLDAIKSEKSDFWVRELLAEPIADLAGVDALPELFEAYQKNFDDNHDNDGFSNTLIEIALLNSEECKNALQPLLTSPNKEIRSHAEWLLEFCTVS